MTLVLGNRSCGTQAASERLPGCSQRSQAWDIKGSFAKLDHCGDTDILALSPPQQESSATGLVQHDDTKGLFRQCEQEPSAEEALFARHVEGALLSPTVAATRLSY